jgi:Cysteine-rich secretory protein family
MIAQRFFAHVSPAGQLLEQRLAPYFSGARTWDVGENLAWGETSMATPRAIVSGWMHSDAHRANILNARFTEIGIGIVSGSPAGSAPNRSATYTTHFGTRAGSTSASSSRRVSAATKRRIRAKCSRAARRTKASRSTRRARTARCVAKRLRAAASARV